MDKELIFTAASLVRDMATHKPMTTDEIVTSIGTIARGLESITMGTPAPAEQPPSMDPKKAIRESSITCLECGKAFKVLTKKHLAVHGLTPEEYRAKYGYRKGQALCAKSLVRERRKKMKDMALWLRRKKPAVEAQQ